VTVELALALPFVVAVLGIVVVALSAVGTQIRLQHAASAAARAHGRGDAMGASAVLHAEAPDASATLEQRNDVVCLTCRRVLMGAVVPIPLAAVGCAPTSGR
jgi:hypothetical protein